MPVLETQPSLRRRLRTVLVVTLVFFAFVALVALGAVVWAAGNEIASPPRRPLQEYHREYLQNPLAHGILLERFSLSDGTPCLLTVPDPKGSLASRGETIRSQLAQQGQTLSAPGKIHGTIVLLHGRKGRKEDYLPIAERLNAVGFRCLLADMPAHGDHPAELAYYGVREASLPARVLSEAAERFHFDPEPAGLFGMSMGGSIAIHSAALPDGPWKAICVISSFYSFYQAIQLHAVWMVGPALSHPLASAAGSVYQWRTGQSLEMVRPGEQAARLDIPTLMLHGAEDQVVPVESGRLLFAALPEKTEKRWIEIPKAGHDNVLITDYPLYATLADWMLRHVR